LLHQILYCEDIGLMHQILLLLCPRPRWGSSQHSLDSLRGF